MKATLCDHTYNHTLHIDLMDDPVLERITIDIVNDSDWNLQINVIFYHPNGMAERSCWPTNKPIEKDLILKAIKIAKEAACPENCITLMEKYLENIS